jgi:hypothetical protein
MTSLDAVTAWIGNYRAAWTSLDNLGQARQFTEWWMNQSHKS